MHSFNTYSSFNMFNANYLTLDSESAPMATVETWLEQWGIYFNPFSMLDAASDPHLSHYLIAHDAFATIWGDGISLIFAPPGGGKTALRIRTARACFVGHNTNRPFPILYLPPLLDWGSTEPTLEEHLAALVRTGAGQLLMALVHRPHWFLRLDEEQRQAVRAVIAPNLPGPLNYYLQLCRQAEGIDLLRERFNPWLKFSGLPQQFEVEELLSCLSSNRTQKTLISIQERWDALVKVIKDVLNFDSIYILLDGLDAVPETAENPHVAINILAPVIETALHWADKQIFFKGFLPQEIYIHLFRAFPDVSDYAKIANVDWNEMLLKQMLHERLYVASEGKFSALDAITSPELGGDLADAIIHTTPLLPREVLVLLQCILQKHVSRVGAMGRIDSRDVIDATEWYQQQVLLVPG